MNTNLQIKVTKNYGKIVYYPSCVRSGFFADLLCQTTFTITDLKRIKKIGFTFTFLGETLTQNDLQQLQ